MTRSADFSPKTRRIIAQRAGYQCSEPTCRRPTIGPGATSEQVAETGMASHIFSAAEGGPRMTGGLTVEQRSAADNGIWLCYTHGKLVDTNAGNAYPVSLLQAWKRLHEARIRIELGGHRYNGAGFVESITIENAFGLNEVRELKFGARHVVVGRNESGKTILANLLSGDRAARTLAFLRKVQRHEAARSLVRSRPAQRGDSRSTRGHQTDPRRTRSPTHPPSVSDCYRPSFRRSRGSGERPRDQPSARFRRRRG